MRKPTAPVIVCLCGSTRFMEQFKQQTEAETLAGKIVLSVGIDLKSPTLNEKLQKRITDAPPICRGFKSPFRRAPFAKNRYIG